MIVDRQLEWLFGGVLAALVIATAVGQTLRLRVRTPAARDVVENLNARIRAWWMMCALFAAAVATGGTGSIVLFALVSFLALREFVTVTPTRVADHRALVWIFFLVTPLQYVLVWIGWYGFFSVLVPVYAFLFVATRMAIAGDTAAFLERAAAIQWVLMVAVYCVSHAPALLMLEIPGYEGQNAKLLFFLVLVVQLSDVLQYVFGKLFGRRPIAPTVSPAKTWEGFVGGVAAATAVGAALWWVTPFSPWQAAAMSLVVALMGFAGGLAMSAVKRGRGVKDWGDAIAGHGGVMDRIDSISFAAPVFFHLTRYFFAA